MTSVQTPHHIKISSVYNGDTSSTETDYIASSIKALRNVYNITGHHPKDTQIGSPSSPIYVSSNGDLTECDHNIDNNAKTATDSIYAEQLKNTKIIDGINFNGTADISHFAICDSDSNEIIKQVTLNNYNLVTGSRLFVKFTNDNAINSPKLEVISKIGENLNTTGSKFITISGENIISNKILKDKIYEFVYDGTNYEIVTFTANRKVYRNTQYEKFEQDFDNANFYHVPSYVVGSNNIQVFLNGNFLTKNVDYKEVGILETTSSEIQFLVDVNKDDEISIVSIFTLEEGEVKIESKNLTIPMYSYEGSSIDSFHWYKIAESKTSDIFNTYGIFSIISSIVDTSTENNISNLQYSEITAGVSNNGISIILNCSNNIEPILKSRIKASFDTKKAYLEIYIRDCRESSFSISMKDNYGWILYEKAVLSTDSLSSEEITDNFSYSDEILMKKNVVSQSLFSLLPYISTKIIDDSTITEDSLLYTVSDNNYVLLKTDEYYINHLLLCSFTSEQNILLPSNIKFNSWYIIKNTGTENINLSGNAVTIDNNSNISYTLRPNTYIMFVYSNGNYNVINKHLGIFEESKETPISANTEITTNNYTVGLNEVNVYVDGIKTKRNVAFSEIGTNGKISNKIKILTDIPENVDFEITISNN